MLQSVGILFPGTTGASAPVFLFLATTTELLVQPTLGGEPVVLSRTLVDAIQFPRGYR